MKNSHIFFIVFAFLLYSCQSRDEKKESKTKPESSKQQAELKASDRAFDDQFIDGKPIYTYLKLKSIDQNVLDYYYGNFVIKQNDPTKKLLETLIDSNQQLLPFYYRCFTEICKDADSTMSIFIGKHAIKLVEAHTEYTMNKLNSGFPDYLTGLISNYIYQRKEWEKEVNELSVRLHQNLEPAPRKLRKELDLFIVGIKNDIEHIIKKE